MEEITGDKLIQMLSVQSSQYPFTNQIIKGKIDNSLTDAIGRNIQFNDCEFEDELILTSSQSSSISILFSNVIFRKGVVLNIHRGSVSIEGVVFQNSFRLNGTQLDCDIVNTKLSGAIELKGSFTTINCRELEMGSEKENTFLFLANVVTGDFELSRSTINNASFANSRFKGLINFAETTFRNLQNQNTNFSNCLFQGTTNFKGANFQGLVIFNSAKFENYVFCTEMNYMVDSSGVFSNTVFLKRVTFDDSRWSSLEIKHTEFAELFSLKDAAIKKLIISKSLFLQGTDFLGSVIDSDDRETFRIIKNEFSKINNQVEALHYGAKEMTAYEKEVWNKKKYGDYLLLFLNRISNLHNQSWIRGVAFTLLTGIGFYAIYLLTLSSIPFQWDWHGWNSFWQASGTNIKYFIRFFIITHDIDFMKDYRPTAASFIIDFVGKIFIGYGIYQTVQAFRKHGKG